jgi:hypothetical protein
MVNLFLERLFCKQTYTIGTLSVGEDGYLCDTLEDTVRDFNKDGDLEDYGELKIWGETAIPYGRYKVIVTYSPKFRRDLPLILDVKHFTGIRMHRGATHRNTNGCVLVGKNRSLGTLTEGDYYEKMLTALLLSVQRKKEDIYINII